MSRAAEGEGDSAIELERDRSDEFSKGFQRNLFLLK